jgi:hypothetical protein
MKRLKQINTLADAARWQPISLKIQSMPSAARHGCHPQSAKASRHILIKSRHTEAPPESQFLEGSNLPTKKNGGAFAPPHL